MALARDMADGMGETAQTALAHFEVASLLQGLDLYAEVASRRVGNLTQIYEVGTLQTVERDHDLQSQLVMEQRVDNGKLKLGIHSRTFRA